MHKKCEPFIISYLGVSIKVMPVVKGLNMEYTVSLPTTEITIEMNGDEEETAWEEIPGGRTHLAQELGDLIEKQGL